jgi:hypothetical protein
MGSVSQLLPASHRAAVGSESSEIRAAFLSSQKDLADFRCGRGRYAATNKAGRMILEKVVVPVVTFQPHVLQTDSYFANPFPLRITQGFFCCEHQPANGKLFHPWCRSQGSRLLCGHESRSF